MRTMPGQDLLNQLDQLTHRAAELLGGPVRAVALDFFVDQAMQAHGRLEKRVGLAGPDPLVGFKLGPGGHEMIAGVEVLRLSIDGSDVRVAKILNRLSPELVGVCHDFYVVRTEDYRRVYRFLRKKVRFNPICEAPAPVMEPSELRRLWQNTVGFLAEGQELLARYGVARKRGVLLVGEPGNGKTMACRWLAAEAAQRELEFDSISVEQYEEARARSRAERLFRTYRVGIVLFDDFDQALRRRADLGASPDQSLFLNQLDGLTTHEGGVVHLFTTNMALEDLDEALLRPGRIDQVIHFPRPTADLRRTMIARWHPEILEAVPVERLVDRTEGLSFAELEELKKLLVLGRVETGRWDWRAALAIIEKDERRAKRPSKLGFGSVVHSPVPTADPLLNER